MATITIPKGWADGDILLEADLDGIKTAVETFLNTTKINDDNLQTAGITASSKLIDATISTAKYADLSVTTAKINDLAVTSAKINDLAITAGKIASSTITGGKIASSTISPAKLNHNVTTVTADYTVLFSDEIVLVDTGSGAVNVTMPTAVSSAFRVTIKKKSDDANKVTILTTSSQLIDSGASGSITLDVPGDSVELVSNGADWTVCNRHNSQVFGKCYMTIAQTITNDNPSQLILNGAATRNITAASNGFTVIYPGTYHITANVAWPQNGAGSRRLTVQVNGAEIFGSATLGTPNGGTCLQTATLGNKILVAGDTVKAFGYQNSSGSLTLDTTNSDGNTLCISRVASSDNF